VLGFDQLLLLMTKVLICWSQLHAAVLMLEPSLYDMGY
jgi:hypothetical protein